MKMLGTTLRFTVTVKFLGELSNIKISSMFFLFNERQHVSEILSFPVITTHVSGKLLSWVLLFGGEEESLLFDKQGSKISNIYYISFKAKVTLTK